MSKSRRARGREARADEPHAARQSRLLAEAAEWRLTGLLFECPSDGWRAQVAALAAEVLDAGLKHAAEAARTEAGEGLYHSIFGPGGPAPAREVSYTETIQPGLLLSELAAYYEAFSYHHATGEAVDHVSVEAGFVGYLRLKEAYAHACGDAARAAVTSDAARAFVAEHLSVSAGPLAASLANSGVTYLSLAGAALLGRAGPRKDKSSLRALPVLTDAREESAFECG
jgi:nitrate reductase assembly molybdenum cofactor insertion protein NarJ